jgi:hypothetical protein
MKTEPQSVLPTVRKKLPQESDNWLELATSFLRFRAFFFLKIGLWDQKTTEGNSKAPNLPKHNHYHLF